MKFRGSKTFQNSQNISGLWEFMGIYGNLWEFMGIYGGLMGIYGGLMGSNGFYPLVNVYITMENHHF
jgi:hypothetical protein